MSHIYFDSKIKIIRSTRPEYFFEVRKHNFVMLPVIDRRLIHVGRPLNSYVTWENTKKSSDCFIKLINEIITDIF